jgi:putative hydrolase of the HAD superfamily
MDFFSMENKFRETGGIKVVLFDFGGVLYEEGFKNGLQAIARLNGLDEETFVRTANDAIHRCGYVVGKVPESTYWEILREITGIRGDDRHLRNEILSRFRMREWMIHIVRRLKALNVRIGILSDQTNWLDELDTRDNFFQEFDHVYNSYHMGKSKKDPNHFRDVVSILKIETGKVLFIDDDLGNCERAKQAGLNVIRYVDREQFLEEIARHFPGITS